MTMERAVIDRIEEGKAVLLVGESERQIIAPLAVLPAGVGPGAWLKVVVQGEAVVQAEADQETTRAREERIKEKMRKLFGKRRG